MQTVKPAFLFTCLVAALASSAASADTKINNVVYQTSSQSVDKQLRMKKLLLFPSVDDVSGVLAPQLDDKLQSLFANYPRFEIIRDPSVIKALGADDASYSKIAQSEKVHREAAKITNADATVVLRTRTVSGTIEMNMDWRDANGALLYSEGGTVAGGASLEARSALIANILTNIVKKIPFQGTVTGRTGQTLTVDLGYNSVVPGDSLDIVKMTSVQRHPLLGVVVATDYVKVGTARVTHVDRVLSFADITEESAGEAIRPDNKIVAIRHKPKDLAPALEEKKDKSIDDERLIGDFDKTKPRMGSIYLDLMYGRMGHDQTAVSGNSLALSTTGGGVEAAFGGELWITREWVASADYSTQSSTMTGTQDGLAFAGGTVARRTFDLAGGYRLFPGGLNSGTDILFSLGYQRVFLDIPTNPVGSFSNKQYAGLFLKILANIYVNPVNRISASVAFQPFSGLTDDAGFLGTPDSATSVGLGLAWEYEFGENLWARFGINYDSSNGSYTNSATVADKRFAIGPGIRYSF